jgi:hypothetical protein
VIAKEEDKRVRITLTVVCDGVSVLGAAYAVVRLS